MLGANQSTEAVAVQPVEPTIHQDHVVPAYWHRWHRGWGWHRWNRWNDGDGWYRWHHRGWRW